MPTSTFFRLPEEKRTRLIDAAWEEFTRTRITDVSINRIIHNAHIPRGSFYQYFVDQEDMFFYLISNVQNHFSDSLTRMLLSVQGDMFQIPLLCLNRFFQHGNTDRPLARCIRMLRINPGMDIQHLIPGNLDHLPESILSCIDRSTLRQRDLGFVEQVFVLLLMATGSAIVATLLDLAQGETQRSILQTRVDIIRLGAQANFSD